jgi:hypothetical protein
LPANRACASLAKSDLTLGWNDAVSSPTTQDRLPARLHLEFNDSPSGEDLGRCSFITEMTGGVKFEIGWKLVLRSRVQCDIGASFFRFDMV